MSDKQTACKKCGKMLAYKTKPPVKCADCKRKKAAPVTKVTPKKTVRKTKRRFPKSKNTKGELLMFAILNNILKGHDFINHGYYSSLPSPKGGFLQLDRYYPGIKLAFEYDGSQHDKFEPYIHKTLQNYQYLVKCDQIKERLCKEQGITLIRVSYKHKVTDEAIKLDIKKHNEELYYQLFRGKQVD